MEMTTGTPSVHRKVNRDGKARAPIAKIGLWLLGALVLVLYMRPWRPIWLDEFLHFAMGGMTWEYALRTIDYTTIEINHGQTGIYMLVDWLLLQMFGASAVALRLPSLLAAGLLLAAAVSFIRLRGLGYLWQFVVILALALHSSLMFFTAEARPYMPLAAAGIAVLTYYQFDMASRRSFWPIFLGVSGIIGGALLHPYIIYIIAVLLPYSIWLAIRDGRIQLSISEVIRFANPWLLVSGALVFIIVGQLTWMRRILSFGYDPLELLASSWSQALEIATLNHFANRSTSLTWIVGLAALTLVVFILTKFRYSKAIIPPLVLLLLSIASSVTVSALSAYRDYWILERQWVAGVALTSVALTWFFAEVFRASQTRNRFLPALPTLAYILLVVIGSVSVFLSQWQTNIQERSNYQQFIAEERSESELRPSELNDYDAFIYAANVNVARREPVWTMFVDWYDNLSGMRPEFRETNPSWTGFLGESRTRPER